MASAAQYHVPTDELRFMVKVLYSAGVDEAGISAHIGLKTPKTLRKHYRKELDEGRVFLGGIALKKLVKTMHDPKSGMAGVTAAIWVTKNTLRWTDKMERSGEGDTNISVAGNPSVQIILPDNGRDHPSQLRGARVMKQIEARPQDYSEVETDGGDSP